MPISRFFGVLAALGIAVFAQPASAQPADPTPLFASDEMIQISIRGDLRRITRVDEGGPATLTVHGSVPETHEIQLSPRGVSRRHNGICTFPPLRVELPARPESGLFQEQRRIKLVTHCQRRSAHQQHVLLEYAAYRLYNAMTDRSFRVRLAQIDYYRSDADTPTVSRVGFFIEDVDDAAERNGMVEVETPSFPPSQLSRADMGRIAVFQYMVGNLDWAVQSGPPGEDCCHNTRPIGMTETATSNLVSLPYDFDQTGLVDAPYSAPPAQIRVSSVRTRVFRGFCFHNAETRAAAAEFLAARPRLEAVLASIPQLSERRRDRATSYLADFFEDIATPQEVEDNLIDDCLT
ncbi:hypothetical protein [Parasphingopyxis sp.]|uniref:hypothetical protein n=1 Tax=Parasphingopyxis sp. TaxID=1920299 RepID=UPI0026267AFD|nr:hypothetical protein [Parasphingopyxis sp.]